MAAAGSSSSSPLSSFLTLFTQSSKAPKTSLSISLSSSSKENNSLPSLSSSSFRTTTTTPTRSVINKNDNNIDEEEMMKVRSVVWPSLAYSNTMYFRAGYNVQVIVDENEHEEKLIGRFRREVMRAGIIQECKRRRYHENKQDEDKRKTREAAKRNRRRRGPFKPLPDKAEGTTKSKKEEDDEDNWELPAGLPN